MITEFFVQLGCTIAAWFGDLFPAADLPTWFASPSGALAQLAGFIVGLGVWVPWTILATSLAGVLTNWVGTVVFKLARAVAAHVPAFGGAGD